MLFWLLNLGYKFAQPKVDMGLNMGGLGPISWLSFLGKLSYPAPSWCQILSNWGEFEQVYWRQKFGLL